MTDTVRLRLRSAEDDGFVRRLRMDHAAASMAGLPPALVEQLSDTQARGFEASLESYDSVSDWIIEYGPDCVGRLICSEQDHSQQLVDLLITPSFRGLGIGGAALKIALTSAASRGVSSRLSVLKSNPAARLYARLGFVVTGSNELNFFMQHTPHPTQQHV